jgi:hypothetical protein
MYTPIRRSFVFCFRSVSPQSLPLVFRKERLDANPDAMRTRREAVEHPFDTIKNVAFRLYSNTIDIARPPS